MKLWSLKELEACRVLSANLHKVWQELKPVCQDLLQAAGQGQQDASFNDFLWAYSTFWQDPLYH